MASKMMVTPFFIHEDWRGTLWPQLKSDMRPQHAKTFATRWHDGWTGWFEVTDERRWSFCRASLPVRCCCRNWGNIPYFLLPTEQFCCLLSVRLSCDSSSKRERGRERETEKKLNVGGEDRQAREIRFSVLRGGGRKETRWDYCSNFFSIFLSLSFSFFRRSERQTNKWTQTPRALLVAHISSQIYKLLWASLNEQQPKTAKGEHEPG